MFVNNGGVIKVHGDGFSSVPSYVVVCRVLPPVIERIMVVCAQKLIVKSQTETGAGQSVRPYFCIFAMTTHLTPVPLFGEMAHHLRMSPGKRVITVANHFKRVVPLWIIGYITMQA